jgi:hypothetical protein
VNSSPEFSSITLAWSVARDGLVSLSGCSSIKNLNAYFILIMQPVVDAFDPRLLISPPTYHTLDFTSMKVKKVLLGTRSNLHVNS